MKKVALENLFLIDIETASEKEDYDSLDAQWKELWDEKISRSLPEGITSSEFYEIRSGIFAEFAKVICISFGYFKIENKDIQLRIKSIYSKDENEVLQEFRSTLDQFYQHHKNWVFCGHNIKEFDMPFLCRRYLVNGIPIPSYFNFREMKPWETPVIDTLHQWRFGDYKHYITLKLLASTLGIPSPKDDIDGSQVGYVFWKENDLKRIAFYCEKDVATVANIMLRFENKPILNSQQIYFASRNS